ncbi:unnamed protein product [Oppiella nova]|uniref:G-protein coupled receptors family 1 profile domain-containing protein n=1 Tax=Oppiella nova TaxID=334625 RepID=A0A7R9QEX0_9ACAR|nr:unnamed protein product [Oppiella nova]CAG2164394.1 unnamed protein product [Oppiella nova]
MYKRFKVFTFDGLALRGLKLFAIEMSSELSVGNSSEAIISLVINSDNMSRNASLAVMRNEKLVILEIAILSLIFILIVFGNSCVLIAIHLHKFKSNRMYYFLKHLSISDTITAVFNVLPQLAWEITHRFYGGNTLCKTIKYLQIFGPYLSSYVLVMTAIDRYQVICKPLSNCGWAPSRSKLMIKIAWIVALLCCLPQIFIFSYQEVPGNTGVYDCWGTFPKPWGERIYVTWYAVSVFIIPFLILTVTHYHICREIWLNLHKKRKSLKLNTKRYQMNATKHTNDSQMDSVTDSQTNSRQTISAKILVTVGKSYRFKGRAKLEVSLDKDFGEDFSPRTHSIHGLSRAKIKTVKITVVVMLCYIMCSTPFICVQLWAYWVPSAQESDIWNVKWITITYYSILYLLYNIHTSHF